MMNLFSAPKETLQVFVNAEEEDFSWTLGAYNADIGAECSAFCEKMGHYLVVVFFKNHIHHSSCHCLDESRDLFKHYFIREIETDPPTEVLKKISSTIKELVKQCSSLNGEHIFYVLDFNTQQLHKSVIKTHYLECLRFLNWTSISLNTRTMFPKRSVMCVIGLREGERSRHNDILTIYRNNASLPVKDLVEKLTDEAAKEDKLQRFTAFIIKREETPSLEEEPASETDCLVPVEESCYEEVNTASFLPSAKKTKSRDCHLWTLFKSIFFNSPIERSSL